MTEIEVIPTEEYKYVRYHKKKDGTMGKTLQVIPKKKVLSRELINKYKDGDTYVYVYKTTFANGETKNITMKRKYTPKKSKDNVKEKQKEIEKIEKNKEEKEE